MSLLGFGGHDVADLGVAFEVNADAQTGAALFRVPVPAPPGRGGIGPTFALTYSSQAGNSPFGAGWGLSGLSTIGIDARKQVPQWDGNDGYQFGQEPLVPWLERQAGGLRPRGFETGEYTVTFYRSRAGGLTLRVEKWVEKLTGRVHFRTRDAGNVLTVYGARPGSAARVADPGDEARTYLWLPELQLDPHGNAAWLEYAAETLDGVDRTLPFERGRAVPAQRYLKRVRYGNAAPLGLTPAVLAGRRPEGLRWCFQLVFDYGDHGAPERPGPTPERAWPVRRDPFSSCRAGFELRTYRLCRRILSFHDFPELGREPTLIGALTLVHDEDVAGTMVRQISYAGYRTGGPAGALPPLRLTYSPAAMSVGFEPAPSETQENVPAGLSVRRHAFVDLLGEGLPGILTEAERSWYYKPNLGNGRFGAQAVVLERPAVRAGTYSYGDYDHDGDTDLAQLAGRLAGFFELDRQEAQWQGFRPFQRLPHVEALGGRAQWVDLNGDGLPDIVVAGADRLVWFPSRANNFGDPVEIALPQGKGAAPLLAENPALDFFFADINGDGLVDLVRVQNGRVEYWPNLGGGRFGGGVLLDGSPQFAPDGEFDAARLRFVDLDGSGTADLVYVGRGEVTCWINASGNQLIPGPRLRGLPYMDQVSTVRVLDFLGDGRPCLVWSSPLPGRESPLQYLPLAPATRPRLLVSVEDSLGRETRLAYSSSAAHYLRDRRAGRPWASRLPTHVTVVDQREVLDHIGATRSVSRYEYREGHFDGTEREFRGFGQVDVYDAEAVTDAAVGAAVTPPTVTRTWFHLGTPMWNHHRPAGTYEGDAELPRIAFHAVESDGPLAEEQTEDALRALAGRVLRREVYAADERGQLSAHPFEVYRAGYRVRLAQPAQRSARAVWSVIPAEEFTATYEDDPRDPRTLHRITVETDAYDQVVREADVAYARRAGRPHDVTAQGRASVLVQDYKFINLDAEHRFELGVLVEDKEYELLGVAVPPSGLITRDRLRARDVAGALGVPRPHHEEVAGLGARLLSWERSFYWNDDRTAALPTGSAGALTLLHHEESACFTPGFVEDVYAGRASPSRLAGLGYILRDGYYWKRTETHHFAPRDQFSLRVAVEASDGGRTVFTYDRHALTVVAVEDALGNRTTADMDYHVLAPWRLTDANGAVREVRYDALGVITLETSRGVVGGEPWGFDALSAVAERAPAMLSEALADPSRYIQGAASFTAYDLDAWRRDRTPTTVITLLREDPLNDGRGGRALSGRIQVRATYLDGLGRTLQAKTLVEPGPAIGRGPDGAVVVDASARPVLAHAGERWLVSGHTVYDAKQRPSRVYEPFFSTTWRFESDEVLRRFGVSSLTVYDALGRVVMQHLPNGTFTRATYGVWEITSEDANDTVMESAYRSRRERLAADDPERQAFEHARAHAGTATTTFLDPRGQVVGTLARGGTSGDRRTELRFDAGELREVIDPRGLVAFRYRRDMEGRLLFTRSADAGDSWALPDADDRLVFTWDGLGVEVENAYDRLGRVTATHVRGRGLDHRVEERVYGETVTGAGARNLLGRLVTVRDQAGETSVEHYDPDGRALRATRRLRAATGEPDWRSPVALDAERFVSEFAYDALGRPRREVLPDGTVRATDYLRGGGINHVRLTTPDGRLRDEPLVNGADFDARGQRTRVLLGNGVEVAYGYDPETARLKTQTARLGSRKFQDIRYSYDAVGNVIRIEDLAHNPGPSSLIAGTAIPARRDYSYDAHYRLARATGRVHQALLEHDYFPGVGPIKGTRHLGLNNGAALERFTQTYAYDASNNLSQTRHLGASRSWTTEMWISATSNRSLVRLDAGGVPVPAPESHFDAGGNVTRMSHLRRLDWNWRGTLARAVIIERPGGTDDAEEYTYGSDGMRVRKVTTRVVNGGQVEVAEKVYFGSCERKRLLRGGALILERWTTHISDGQGRVALVHRWVTDTRRRETDDPRRPRVVYQLTTHQNSGAVEIDREGNLVSYEEYFPYGGTAFIAGDRARDIDLREYRYTGKERDDATNLYYFGHRYYAPWTCRWLSPDPIGPADDLNLYQFVLGDPVGNVDPNGLQTSGQLRYGGDVTVAPGSPLTQPLPPGHDYWYCMWTSQSSWCVPYTAAQAQAEGLPYYRPVLPQTTTSPPVRQQRPSRRASSHPRSGRPNRPRTVNPPVTRGGAPPTGAAGSESRSTTQGSVAVAGGGGQVAGPSGAPADSSGTGDNSDSGATSSGVAGDQAPGTVGTGGTAGTGPPSAASAGADTGTQPGESTVGTIDQTAIGPGGDTGAAPSGHGPGLDASDPTSEALGPDSGGANDGDDTGDAAEGQGIGEGEGAGHGSGVGEGHSPGGGEHHSSQRGERARERQGTVPGGSPRRVPGADGTGARSGTGRSPGAAEPGPSGTGTETGGATVPGSQLSAQGQPAPPGLRQNGNDPNGSASGSLSGTRGGTSDTGSPQGTGHGERRGTGGHGGNDGSPRGGNNGSPQGVANRREDILDTASRWAGYANFEFGGGSARGAPHGIPGGHGRWNLGRFGQILHIALTIMSWVGPGAFVRAGRMTFHLAANVRRAGPLATRFARFIGVAGRNLFRRAPLSRGYIMLDAGAITNLAVERATAVSLGVRTAGLRALERVIGERQMVTTEAALFEAQMQVFQFAGTFERAAFEQVARSIQTVSGAMAPGFARLPISRAIGEVEREAFGIAAQRGWQTLATDRTFFRTIENMYRQNNNQVSAQVVYYLRLMAHPLETLRYLGR